ncbi:MAG: beta strand repeat-containing protein [Panacagrimonas sp.]
MKNELLLATLVGGALLVSACGGGGGGGGSTPDPDPDPVDPCPESFISCSGNVFTISGDVNANYTMDPTKDWRLAGVVRVGNGNGTIADAAGVAAVKAAGVTLTIPAGTNIKASGTGVLLVTRGSKLNVNGTASQPVTISSLDDNFNGEGEWGGVVIQGFAPQFGKNNTGICVNSAGVCNIAGEGGSAIGNYGGNDPADDSGSISYLRIAEGGLVAGPNNEVNGLTLMGVGHGTDIQYIHIHNNLDDGIEWFGGTVSVRYAVLTNNDDDDIDFDEGWSGNLQYAIVQKNPTKLAPTGQNDPRGIEANSSNNDFVPQTNAVLANLTILGGTVNNAGNGQPGMLFRGAVTANVFNSAVRGFNTGCVLIQNATTTSSGVVPSVIGLTNVLGDCGAGGFFDGGSATTSTNAGASPFTVDNAYAINEAQARLGSATTITAANNGSNFMFDQTNYIGAVAPGTTAANAWWAGWTIPGVLSPAAEVPAAASFVSCNTGNTVCTVTGTINTNYTFVRGVEWRLDGTVRVGSGNGTISDAAGVTATKAAGVTLTVRSGVNVKGLSNGVLLVTRGSKLIAEGTADAPITFSSLDDNFAGEGEWGGMVIQGFAPQFGKTNTGTCVNSAGVCNIAGEGGASIGNYGGNDPADNSGVLRYVRIAEGGLVSGPNNEVNGLTLMGVGYGTQINYVQVHNNLDDGIEWFGGTVNATHVVLTNNDDDDIDFDEGWMGNLQYGIVVKNQTKVAPTGQNDPRGIEANSSNNDFVPQTNAALANLTIIGGTVNNAGNGQPGMLFRGAVTTNVFNSAVRGFNTGCVLIQNATTTSSGVVPSVIGLTNVLGDCGAGGFYDGGMATSGSNAVASTVTIDQPSFALTNAAASLGSNTAIAPVANGSNFVFDQTNYIGAVRPGTTAANAWWTGWTIPGSLTLSAP